MTSLSTFELVVICADSAFLCQLFGHFPPDTLMRLAGVNTHLYYAVMWYSRCIWDISSFFSSWFSSPLTFRSILRQSNSVVLGHCVYQFFEREITSSSDLDIYVCRSGLKAMGQYLASQGYIYLPSSLSTNSFEHESAGAAMQLAWHHSYRVFGIARSFVFARVFNTPPRTNETKFVSIIRIYLLWIDPIRYALSFTSSIAMNIITADCAISLFPRSTFVDYTELKCSRILASGGEQYAPWVNKLDKESRKSLVRRDPAKHEYCTQLRSIGDEKSWIIDFDRTIDESDFSALGTLPTLPFPRREFSLLDWRSGEGESKADVRIGDQQSFFSFHNTKKQSAGIDRAATLTDMM